MRMRNINILGYKPITVTSNEKNSINYLTATKLGKMEKSTLKAEEKEEADERGLLEPPEKRATKRSVNKFNLSTFNPLNF